MTNIQRQRIGYDWSWLIILAIILSVILAGLSCTSERKMVMPVNCKPPKRQIYHMVEPKIYKHEKRFMKSKPKTKYDYDKEKQFQKTGK